MTDLADASPAGPGPTVRFPGIPAIVDGSEAIAHVETRIAEVACAYPITPSTTMAAVFQSAVAAGQTNLWRTPLAFIEPESEHSSASAAEGVALAGGRVTNFTAGQGLILMKEVLYVLSGKRLPVVFHIGARALTSQALNIHAGHDDVMGIADTGWGILFARNAQEAADLTAIARRVAEETHTPFFVVQDGFLTTHTLENVQLPEDELLRTFVGDPREQIDCLFDPDTALMTGVVQNQDSYMKGRIAQRAYYSALPSALTAAMDLWVKETGRRYNDIDAYRCDDAEEIVVAMGTIADTARAVVEVLRGEGRAVGSVGITSYRPFPATHLAEVLRGAKVVAVVERTDEPAAADNPLTRETKAALYSVAAEGTRVPRVVSVSAGLGSRDVDAGDLAGVFDWSRGVQPGDPHFGVVGVRHPLAVPPRQIDISSAGSFALRGHSIGGLGSITTNKLLATVMGEAFGKHVQAYPRYGSEKKGLPTSYSLTIADEPIRGHGELRQVDLVSLHDVSAFALGDPLAGLVDGGTVFVQSPLTDASAIWTSIPATARADIVRRRIRVTALDTAALARARSPRPDLTLRLQGVALVGAFLRMTTFAADAGLDRDAMLAAVGSRLRRFYGKRGDDVLAANLAMVASAFDGLIDVSERLGLPAGPRREVVPIPDQSRALVEVAP